MPMKRRIRLPAGEPAAVDDSKWACPDCGVSIRAAAMAGLTHVCLSHPGAENGESSAYLYGFAGVSPPATAPVEFTAKSGLREFKSSGARGNSRGPYRHYPNFEHQREAGIGDGIGIGENPIDEEDDASSVTLTADLQIDLNLEDEALGGGMSGGLMSFRDFEEGASNHKPDQHDYGVGEKDGDDNAADQTSPSISPHTRKIPYAAYLESNGEVRFQAGSHSDNRRGAGGHDDLPQKLDVARETSTGSSPRYNGTPSSYRERRVPAKVDAISMIPREDDSEFRAQSAKTALSRLGHKWAVADQFQASLIAASTTPHKRATAAHARAVASSTPRVTATEDNALFEATLTSSTPKQRSRHDRVDHLRTPHSLGQPGITNHSIYYSARTHMNESSIGDDAMPISPLTEASMPAHEDFIDFSLTPNARAPLEVGPMYAAPSPWAGSVSRIQGFSNHRSRSASPRTLSPRKLSPRPPRSGENDGSRGSSVSSWRQRLGLTNGRSRRGRSASPRPAARYLATVNAQNRAHDRGIISAREHIAGMGGHQRKTTTQSPAKAKNTPSAQTYSATASSNYGPARIGGRSKYSLNISDADNVHERGRRSQPKSRTSSRGSDPHDGEKAGFWDAEGRWNNFATSQTVNNDAKDEEHFAKPRDVMQQAHVEHKSIDVTPQPRPPRRSSPLLPDSPPEVAHKYHNSHRSVALVSGKADSKDKEVAAARESAKLETKQARNVPITTPQGNSSSSSSPPSSSHPSSSIGLYSPGVVAAAARAQAFRAYNLTPSARATPLSFYPKSAASFHQVESGHQDSSAPEVHRSTTTKPNVLPLTASKKGIKMTPSPGTIPFLDSNYESKSSSPLTNVDISVNLLRDQLDLAAADNSSNDANAENRREQAKMEKEIDDDNDDEAEEVSRASDDDDDENYYGESRWRSRTSSSSSYARHPMASADLAKVLGTDSRRDKLIAAVHAAASSSSSKFSSSVLLSSSSCLTPSAQAALARYVCSHGLKYGLYSGFY